jgi:Flp pilus assembly protein TadD
MPPRSTEKAHGRREGHSRAPAERPRADRRQENGSRPTRAVVPPILVILAGLIAYSNSFSGTFVLDDDKFVVNNPRIRAILPLAETMRGRRPIVDLSLAVNYARGGLDLRGYHVFNLTVHLLAGLTLLGVVRRTLSRPQFRKSVGRAAPWLAAVIAAVWVVHPLQTQSVTYIIQRGESLMGLLYLLTLYCVIRGAEAAERAGGVRASLWCLAAVISCALGMGTKAVIVTAPVVMLLYDWIFLSRSLEELFRRRWALYLGLVATWAVLGVCGVAEGVLAPGGKSATVGFGYKGITPLAYLGTQLGVLTYYLRLSVWPHPLCLDFGWAVARHTGEIIVPGLVILTAVGGTVWALIRRPALGFVGLWFFLILAPTSSFVPIKDPAFEHRMYLSLAAIAACVVLGGHAALRRLFDRLSLSAGTRTAITVVVAYAIIASLTLGTIRRNGDYHGDLDMWQDVIDKRPANARGHLGMGTALFARERTEESEAAFAEAVRLRPTYADAHYNLGNALAKNGKLEASITAYQRSLRLNPRNAKCHYNLANTYKKLRRWDDAVAEYREAVRIDPEHISAYINLGNTLRVLSRVDEAIEAYHKAIAINPRYANAHYNLGRTLEQQGDLHAAVEEFRLAVEYDPTHDDAREALDALTPHTPEEPGD